MELIRRFAAGLDPQPEPSVLEEFQALASRQQGLSEVPALLTRLGMPAGEAQAVSARLETSWQSISTMLMLYLVANQDEVLAPIKDLTD